MEIHVHEEEVIQPRANPSSAHAPITTPIDIPLPSRRRGIGRDKGRWQPSPAGDRAWTFNHRAVADARLDSEEIGSFDRILLALDGDPRTPILREIAQANFAGQLKSTLLCWTVVPTYGTLSSRSMPLRAGCFPSAYRRHAGYQ